MNLLPHAVRGAGLLAWLALLSGCAGAPSAGSSTAQDESLLVAAGFKTVVASTEAQLKNLPALPPDEIGLTTVIGQHSPRRRSPGVEQRARAELDGFTVALGNNAGGGGGRSGPAAQILR